MITRRFTKHELTHEDLKKAVVLWLEMKQGFSVPEKRISFSTQGHATAGVMLEEGIDYGAVEVGPDDVRTSGGLHSS